MNATGEHMGNRRTAPLILNLGTKLGWSATPRPFYSGEAPHGTQ